MFLYIVKRVLLSLVTLWLLTTLVFLMAWTLPSDPARAILGHTAPEASVVAFREQFGLNDPFLTQYWRLLKGLITFDFGLSWGTKRPVWDVLGTALFRTAKLATLAMVITAPISIFAGLVAAKHRDRRLDRGIVLTGLATSSIPEFVTGTLLAVIFGVKLGWFKAVAIIPDGTPPLQQLNYLILPAMALAIVYFGYIARMMRAGTIQAMDSDYVRTASMKGLSDSQVMRKHVMRNALAPTITVMSVQVGYLVSGIVGVEVVFNYPGFSQSLLIAVKQKDLPVLQVAVIVSALVYMVATLLADLTIAWLNPRIRLEMSGA